LKLLELVLGLRGQAWNLRTQQTVYKLRTES
jgi:hypothetical protein